MATKAQIFATDMFGNKFHIGNKVIFAHQSKLLEGVVTNIEWLDGPVHVKRTTGTGPKLPKEPKRDGDQLLLIDEIAARPNQ